ncbi:MAG TPA: carboxypeptidase-like regulatory domain-containing protein [bacterium]|nr:carboxypeptidase-like regulatory domain-containing protein [bacterium]
MPMVKKTLYITLLLAALACRSNLFLGKVEGVAANIYAPNGRTPAYRAEVVVADLKAGGYYGETVTSATGYFAIAGIPDGLYRINVTSPNGFLKTGFHVDVVDGYSAADVEVLLAPARVGTFFNVPGRYDDMGALFADLGYLYKTVRAEAFAGNQNPLRDADILCLNSGVDLTPAQEEAFITNLRSFVEEGGLLITSDRAWPFLKAAWPGKVTWRADPEIGKPGQDVDGVFVDADLRKYATISKWRLKYDLGNWAIPDDTTGTVFVSGDVETSSGTRGNAPLLIGFAYGRGFVAFSTFDWRKQYGHGRVAIQVFNYLITNK